MPPSSEDFLRRLREHPEDGLEAFAEAEIMSGLPFIFANEGEMTRFQKYVADALGISKFATDVFLVGSAKTGFSLDPEQVSQPFQAASDIDVVVVHADLFDEAWGTMLGWDYLTMRNRSRDEQRWLYQRHNEVWSGWYDPGAWHFRERGGIELSFPDALKPVRKIAYQWFAAFRSLSRYRHHTEIPRHKISARLYRTRRHVAMYHVTGLRAIRRQLAKG
jgi:hypothetical protein